MTDTSAKILPKGCDKTGLTPDLAKTLYAGGKGSHVLAIVELRVKKTHNDLDTGNKIVDLVVDTIEPIIDGQLNGTLDEHVRNIQAALYRNRKLGENNSDELPFGEEDGPAPSVSEIIAQGKGLPEALDEPDDPAHPDVPGDGDEQAELEQPDEAPDNVVAFSDA